MTSHTKTRSVESSQKGQVSRLRSFFGAFATRVNSLGGQGSGAPLFTLASFTLVYRAGAEQADLSAKRVRSRGCRRLALAVLPAALALALLVAATPALADPRPPRINEAPSPGTVTTTTAGPFEAGIFSEVLAVKWRFEYATTQTGIFTPVPGGSGSSPASSDLVKLKAGELTGLTPETTYYVRLVVENTAGEVSETKPFETTPLHPRIGGAPSISGVTATSVHLVDVVIPDNFETEWRFEYAISETGPWTVAPGAEGTIPQAEADEAFHNVSGDLTGLNPATAYYVRLFAKNGHGPERGEVTSGPVGFETFGPPTAVTFAVHAIHADTIRALGSVKPDGFDAHYHFEYVDLHDFETEGGFASSATKSTPEVDLGSGEPENETVNGHSFVTSSTRIVAADLPGLQPGVEYRYRLSATSTYPGNPIVHGSQQTVLVPAPAEGKEEACPNASLRSGPSTFLPDCRAYELVTPQNKGGAQDIYNNGAAETITIPGEDGEHVAVETLSKWGSSPGNALSTYDFSRTPAGWQMTSLTPQPEAGEVTYDPQLFSPDLTQFGLLTYTKTKFGANGHSPEQDFLAGSAGAPYASVASSPYNQESEGTRRQDEWVAASEDFSKLILETEDHSLLGNSTGTTSGFDLYEYSAGGLRQLNVLTGGSPIGACGAKMAQGFEGYNGGGPGVDPSSRNAVSADGSRVFFEADPNPSGCPTETEENVGGPNIHLYMRVRSTETVDIGDYNFVAANPEGTKLLLRHQSGETMEFILYNTVEKSAKPLFSTHEPTGGEQRLIVSSKLAAFYFRSRERLTPEAPSTSRQDAGGSAENIYRYDISSETLHFVVQAGSDGNLAEGYSVTPDGRYLYFDSFKVAGVPGGVGETAEVYRYDSVENTVQCMSCASPFDPEPKLVATFLAKGAATELRSFREANHVPQPRVSSDNGDYVFFDTPSALVSQDVNGEVSVQEAEAQHPVIGPYTESSDVYEWRKNGVDGCSRIEGCIQLITTGRGDFKDMLLGTTPSGHDVFFATHEPLVPQDTGTAGDVYDARIGGGYPPPPPRPVECEGDACSTPFAAPNDATPSSSTFHGAGNLLGVTLPEVKIKPKPKKKIKAKRRKPKKQAKPKRKGKRSSRAKRVVQHHHGGVK
jgi:hypothetical protein